VIGVVAELVLFISGVVSVALVALLVMAVTYIRGRMR
jgi:hypothetical protein